LVLATYAGDGPFVFRWPWWLWPLKVTLFVLSLYLFYAGFKAYGFLAFLGLRSPPKGLIRKGILSRLRHPLYTGGLLFLWARNQTLYWFWVDLLLSAYLLIGTYWEEKKLISEFGEDYLRYRKEVHPFWPRLGP
jgi:protein-S-isoprenylcysteine O-methyltransferase Ste14